MPYVNDRWLGGSLTNYRTIRSRLTRLEELEAIRAGEQINTYSKKDAVGPLARISQDVRNLNGMRTMAACRVLDRHRSEKEKNAISEARKLGVATMH